MLFENNGTLQKWHMTNTPPEVDKYDTHKILCLVKMAQTCAVRKYDQRLFAEGGWADWFLKLNA